MSSSLSFWSHAVAIESRGSDGIHTVLYRHDYEKNGSRALRAQDDITVYSTSLPWHFLYLRPEPHQQGSLRPSLGPACWARLAAAATAGFV